MVSTLRMMELRNGRIIRMLKMRRRTDSNEKEEGKIGTSKIDVLYNRFMVKIGQTRLCA
jgi:hypothetical protein